MITNRNLLARSAALASISVAVLLVALKLWATWRTGSVAMLGSLADSALDMVASIATLIGVWIAAMPADEDHRFGHGKAESLAAMFQVLLITLSAGGIAYRAVMRLIEGGQSEAAQDGIIVSVIAIIATFALLAWQRYVLAHTGSVAIRADHVHYQSDLLLNLAVIAALVLDQYLSVTGADSLFGLAIAAWLLWGAWRAASEAVDHLMDREWPAEEREAFLAVLAQQPDLRGVHDLRTRRSGADDFAQFHMAVDPGLTIVEVHDLMDEVEARLAKHFPGVEVLIHPDPVGLVNEEGDAAEELLPELAQGDDT